jgi:hypothetical protein
LDDSYPTPSWTSQVVLPYLPPRVIRAWDPAEGAGGMVRALTQAGLPTVGTRGNFLEMSVLPDSTVNAVVTNPPYGAGGRLAVCFIEHALKLVPITAMLLRVDFDSGRTRQHLFRNCPAFACKLTLLDRIEWFPGEYGSSTNHAWFIWDRQHSGAPTIAYAGKADVLSGVRAVAQMKRLKAAPGAAVSGNSTGQHKPERTSDVDQFRAAIRRCHDDPEFRDRVIAEVRLLGLLDEGGAT